MPNKSFGVYYKWVPPRWKYRPGRPCSGNKAWGPAKGSTQWGPTFASGKKKFLADTKVKGVKYS